MDNQKYKTGYKRFLAAIVDSIIFIPLVLLERLIFKTTQNSFIIFAWLTFSALLPISYSILLHYKYGQTIGKWVAGIKVIDINEIKNINLKQAVFRDIFYLLAEVIGLCYFLVLLLQSPGNNYLLEDYKDFAATPFFIWTLLELITMFTNYKRRAIHDFLAKSVVVRT